MDEQIVARVVARIKQVKNIPEVCDEKNFDLPLTGQVMHFTSHDLVYVILELMDEFHVVFDKEDVVNYRFNTIHGIAAIIEHKLNLTV